MVSLESLSQQLVKISTGDMSALSQATKDFVSAVGSSPAESTAAPPVETEQSVSEKMRPAEESSAHGPETESSDATK